MDPQVLDIPIVKRPVILKLQRANRVRNPLNRIALAVRVVIHRVDAPLIARPMMLGVQNAVHHRVAHVEVRRRHIDLRPQRAAPIRKLARPHPRKQLPILRHAPVAKRARFPRFRRRAARLAHLLRRQIANISLPVLNQLHRPIMQLAEVIGGVEKPVLPIETQPLHVFDNRIDILRLFLRRVRIIEPQIALAAELLRQPKIQADRFGMANMQIPIGLGRKARMHPAAVLAGGQILHDDLADKVRRAGFFWALVRSIGWHSLQYICVLIMARSCPAQPPPSPII